MKKKITVFAIILCVAFTSSAFARGHNKAHHGGHHYRSDYHQHRGGRHHHNGLGLAVGLVGGLVLGSALVSSATPPPSTVVYGVPYTTYQTPQPVVVVPPPRICVEDRVVGGEWQVSNDGRQVWVSFPYPVTQRVQVPCY